MSSQSSARRSGSLPDEMRTPETAAESNASPKVPSAGGKEEHEQEVLENIADAGDRVHSCDGAPLEQLLDMKHPNYQEIATADGMYRGQVRLDGPAVFEGYGCLRSSDSTSVGYWRDGRLHGEGSQSWSDGRLYTGEFSDGGFSGHGRMQWQHPRGVMVYEGQYLNDKKHGNGRFVWPSGKAYEGQWVCGMRHGMGVDTNPCGTRCHGIWEDNILVQPIKTIDGGQTSEDCPV